MDPATTNVTPPAPAASTTTATAKPVSGEMVAGAAGTIALALSEFQDRGLTTSTKMAGGEAIAKLYKLRQYMIGTWDRCNCTDARPSGAT